MTRMARCVRGGFGLMTAVMLSMAPVMAQPVFPPENTITTSGQGQVQVKPDSLSVVVMVESQAKELAAARTENNRKMQAVIAALKQLGIPNMTLETTGVNAYPVHEQRMRQTNLPEVVGYRVSNSLNVRVRRAEMEALSGYASRIVETALNAGANNVHGLGFFLDNMGPAKTAALKEAFADAKRNAQALAEAAGVTLNRVYTIEGEPQFGGYPRPMPVMSTMAMERAEVAPAVPVETGEMTVTSQVTVRYRF